LIFWLALKIKHFPGHSASRRIESGPGIQHTTMEYYNNILCVSYPELVSGDPRADKPQDRQIMSKAAYDKYVLRYPMVRVRLGGGPGSPALLSWERLREDLKRAVREKYCSGRDPYVVVRRSFLANAIEGDPKAQEYYLTYTQDGCALKLERQVEYYANAIVLNAVHKISNDRRGRRLASGGRKTNFWESMSEAVNNLDRSQWPHKLPSNARALQRRVAEYVSGGYEALIHKGIGNKNSAKVDDPQKTSFLQELLADGRNLDNQQVAMLYNMVASKMDWEPLTASAIDKYREEMDLVIHAGRRGKSSLRNNKTMQVKRSAPSFPLYLWTMDGWDAELLYQKEAADAKGRKKTTYHNRLCVVVVLDPCTKYPVGYAIGTHETPELNVEALHNALDHVRDLFGGRYRPHQLQSDNYAKSVLHPIYQVASGKHVPAAVRNAKSKIVEPYFRQINKQYCQLLPNWSGFGVTSNKNHQPSDDFLSANRHSFPDESGCRRQIEMVIEKERAASLAAYKQRWEDMSEEDRLPMDEESYLYLFGATTGWTNRLRGDGLTVTIAGRERVYDSFDANFRKYGYVDWIVKYDPRDLSRVLVVNATKKGGTFEETGTLRFMLEEKYVQPMALKERTEDATRQLGRVREFNRSLEEHIVEQRALSAGQTQQLLEDPRLNDTLSKFVLCDSLGQHKNERNMGRLRAHAVDVQALEAPSDEQVVFDPEAFVRDNF